MSVYFQWVFEISVDGYAHIETTETLHTGFYRGLRLGAQFPPTTVSLKSRPRPPEFIEVGSLDLVSERLRDLLLAEGVNAEFLPVEVVQGGRRVDGRYFEMNVLDVFVCLDRERSRFRERFLSGSNKRIVSWIDELYVDESKVGGSRLFVMEEKLVHLVRADLTDALRAGKFRGLAFRALPTGPF